MSHETYCSPLSQNLGPNFFLLISVSYEAQINFQAHYEVIQHLQGIQGEVGGPKVPLLSHWDEIETPNWAVRAYRT